tara:strand:- start:801 stop:1391 length:591 start_codon:yes stop_codon:yes gene_type:complete
MNSLLERFENQRPSEFKARSEESLIWLRDNMRGMRVNVDRFYKQSDFNKTDRYLEGRMYSYFYDPKYAEVLPYYDIFPVTLILQLEKNGFMGLNLHYIPPRYRIALLDQLYRYAVKDDEDADDMQTRLRISWDILRSAAKLKWAKPCLKRYLTSHVVGPALEVTPDHWDTVAMLPLARFQKQGVRQVYTESRNKVI